MAPRKSYGQFCGLARALDHIGDRWTLLIIRDLLAGERSFRSLQASLAGISPNLLLHRLRSLITDDLVERSDDPTRSKHVTYALTPPGRSLEPIIADLIRWGARYMGSGPQGDRVDPAWTELALRALLEGPTGSTACATLHLEVGGYPLTITIDRGRRNVEQGHVGVASARLEASMPEVVAVASGLRPVEDLTDGVEGDVAVVRHALSPEADAILSVAATTRQHVIVASKTLAER
jgi:DNA-binding HxlR family transcriptional regulator